ncbi:Crp/Fnr family transcriptional regulator [soil metagenome]
MPAGSVHHSLGRACSISLYVNQENVLTQEPLRLPLPLLNSLLASLSEDGVARIANNCERVYFSYGDVLYTPGEKVNDIYFPETCLISLLGILNIRTSLEVGLIGCEGVVGISATLGIEKSYVHAVVQAAGSAIKISSAVLLAEVQKSPLLQFALIEYINRSLAQTIQIAVCSKFHMLEARLARSLLTTRDHLQSNAFHLTHETIAHALGVRRVGVTKAASALQRQHLISYTRGEIQILDHAGLESVSCECYQIIKDIRLAG